MTRTVTGARIEVDGLRARFVCLPDPDDGGPPVLSVMDGLALQA